MSEELKQRGLTEHGLPFGQYEFYNIGSTTIRSLRAYKIIPNQDYTGFEANKPDALLVDRRNKNMISVMAVVENKTSEELNTPDKIHKAIEQCVFDYCKPLNAKFGIISDTRDYIWVNPQLPGDDYQAILREDGYPLHSPFWWNTQQDILQTLRLIERLLAEISPTNSQLKKPELKNPSNLADRVWQTIWLASGENPDTCLATFVEIFVFKYLSDLGVLIKDATGVSISFNDVLAVPKDRCLVYYFQHVRSFIKYVFPPSQKDGTSIINSIVLNPKVEEHNTLFHKILREFGQFGPLKNIDPEFKSRLYEHFLKKSISQKNWGQYFTPRNIVKAMVEISDIEQLPDGSKVHDPGCGVGGFILEPILTKRPGDYFLTPDGHLKSKLCYTGYDRDIKTIILAKANMLIHLNELMQVHPNIPSEFAHSFNETFTSVHTSVLGSIAHTPNEEYDLVMTNPPFVITGTSKIKEFIRDSGQLTDYYKVNASGIEGLFLEQIIRSLKPGAKALVIVPEGVVNRLADNRLRRFVLDQCILDAVISLPKNAFYTSSKKTYIVVLIKKPVKELIQTEPVFTYLTVNTGETLDAKRFECENDLPEMVRLFKYFKADKLHFNSTSEKCKIWPIDRFDPDLHWSVDRWWTEDEKIALGMVDEKNLVTISNFISQLETSKSLLDNTVGVLKSIEAELPQPQFTVDISLSDKRFFELFIGKRILKKDLYLKSTGVVPLFSANVKNPFGMLDTSNISDFSRDSVLWGIDGNFEFSVMKRGTPFATTDHAGCIRILDDDIDPYYLYYYLMWIRSTEGLDRALRASLKNMQRLQIRFPVLVDEHGTPRTKPPNKSPKGVTEIYHLDIETQKQIAQHYRTFETVKSSIASKINQLTQLEIPPII